MRDQGRGFRASAPGHGPGDDSVAVYDAREMVWIESYADDKADVLEALGLTFADLYDNPKRGVEYRYPDGHTVRRLPDPQRGKTIRQDRGREGNDLYRVEFPPDEPVYIVEGEGNVEAVEREGASATTSCGGAQSPDKADWSPLRGHEAIIVRDADDAGRTFVKKVCAQLDALNVGYRVVEGLNGAHDVVDHLALGHSLDDLVPVEAEVIPIRSRVNNSDAAPTNSDGIVDGRDEFAELFAERFSGRFLHVHGIGWLHWTGTVWAEDHGDKRAIQAARSLVKSAWANSVGASTKRLNLLKKVMDNLAGVLKLAEGVLSATVAELDADPYLLNTPTGVVDLRTGAVAPHDPALLMTRITLAGPDPASGEWRDFTVSTLRDSEVRRYVQRILGMGLIGKVERNIFPIWIGSGGNGKGAMYATVNAVLGGYSTVLRADVLDANNRREQYELADLRGARLAFVSEVEEGMPLSSRTVKWLTGGDRLKTRQIYRAPIEFDPSHTLCMITNFPPVIVGDDGGLKRRVRLVDFPEQFTDGTTIRGKTLPDYLQQDAASEVVAWLIAGCVDYLRDGLGPTPAAVEAKTTEFFDDADVAWIFLSEECSMVSLNDIGVSRPALHAAYTTWCASRGVEPKDAGWLTSEVRKKLPKLNANGERVKAGGKGGRVWKGLALGTLKGDPIG
ncbi:phage/plasmid primase, P4 family [Tsukamurella strandjordii]|uniref:phage/plasmid primase, P4 family n=1 Tax=Tsukamurella TaxID=2060 RepID=UPI001C7DA7AC|nr:phage/plasmid primase, P4 family [Tsukamurella sp. TY48]